MSTDEIGTVRREDHEDGYSIWLRFSPNATPGNEWTCVHSTDWPRIESTRSPDEVAAFPVIGVVPGTPAEAEAEAAVSTCRCVICRLIELRAERDQLKAKLALPCGSCHLVEAVNAIRAERDRLRADLDILTNRLAHWEIL